MSETIKVQILSDGITAKEVNRFQKLIYKDYFSEMSPIIGKKATLEMYHRNNNNFQEAEDKLRTFTIESYRNSLSGFFIKTHNIHQDNITMFSGKIVEAEILDNDKLIIRIL